MMLDLVRRGLAIVYGTPPADPPAGHVRTNAELIEGGPKAPELCMLATDRVPVCAAGLSSPRWSVQLKVDGVRALWIDQRIVTREGVPLDCAGHCAAALHRLEQHLGEPYFFDGEYVEEAGFNATVSAVRKGRGTGAIWLFDALPLRLWRDNRCDLPLEHRLRRLQAALPHTESVYVGGLQHMTLPLDQALRRAHELSAMGYEGAVLKRSGSMYSRERSADWVKVKQRKSADAEIVDVRVIGHDNDEAVRAIVTVRSPEGWTAKLRLPRCPGGFEQAWRGAGDLLKASVDYFPVCGGGWRDVRIGHIYWQAPGIEGELT